MYKNYRLGYLLTLITLLLIGGCRKDENTNYISSSGGASSSISGIVVDENNLPINGVSVFVNGNTTVTNNEGVFYLRSVYSNSKRCVVEFEKTGYFNRSHAYKPLRNSVNYMRIVMQDNGFTHTVSAVQGGLVSLPDNSSILFTANSFVNSSGNLYNGTVYVTFKHLSPDDADFGFSIPGGDLSAINSNGEDVMLYSFGMLGVLLKTSTGDPLQIASGTAATISMPVASFQLAQANATIPLWYFDESVSLWKEQGQATLIGNNYVGTVTHFSWWNYDYQGPRATIKGKVVDCSGQALGNVSVTINGWYVVTTNSNGEYITDLPVNMLFTVQVLTSNNGGIFLNSQIENVPLLTNGQIYTVADLVVPCPTRVSGVAKKCNGEQTDAMVLFKNSTGHIIYSYTTSGAFDVPVVQGENYNLWIFNSLSEYTQQITTNSNINLGTVALCNASLNLENYLILDDGASAPQLYEIDVPLVSKAILNGVNSVLISIDGISITTLDTLKFYIGLNDTLTGYHSWVNTGSGFTANIINDTLGFGSNTTVYSNNLSGGITVTEFGNIGEAVTGTFAGNAIRGGNVVTINGKFGALREQ